MNHLTAGPTSKQTLCPRPKAQRSHTATPNNSSPPVHHSLRPSHPQSAAGELSAMTTARLVSTSPGALYYSPAYPASKSLGRSSGRVAFPARPYGALLHLSSPVMASAGAGGNGSPNAQGGFTGSCGFHFTLHAASLGICSFVMLDRCELLFLLSLLKSQRQ